MHAPILISDILCAVERRSSLRTIDAVKLSRNAAGRIRYFVGNSAVVIPCERGGEKMALRCYRRKMAHLNDIYGEDHHPEELEVWCCGKAYYIDVVLCGWVEGEPLSVAITHAVEDGDISMIGTLNDRFKELATQMLRRQEWAHGDLSGDNIIVGEDGNMHLIDLDGCYIPKLKGLPRVEIGTPAYQPSTTARQLYSPTMDHFSIALIAVSLKALSLNPMLSNEYPFLDGILLDGARVTQSGYEVMEVVTNLLASRGEAAYYRMARSLRRGEVKIEGILQLLEHNEGIRHDDIELFERGGVWGYHDCMGVWSASRHSLTRRLSIVGRRRWYVSGGGGSILIGVQKL